MNKNQAVSLILVAVLVTSSFLVVNYAFKLDLLSFAQAEPPTMNVSIVTDRGGNLKLSPGEVLHCQANVSFTDKNGESVDNHDPLKYLWTVTPHGAMSLLLNGQTGTYVANEPVTVPQRLATLTFAFGEATTAEVWINLEATDSKTGQSATYTIIVVDPASYPSQYNDAFPSDATYVIRQDESNSYYYAIDGKTGQIKTAWTSTNLTATTASTLAAMTSGKLKLDQQRFNYSLTIPDNVLVEESYQGSIRKFINDDTDSAGSPYTVSVDAVVAGYYMCQDAADSYINSFTSTNGIALIQTVANTLTSTSGTIMLSSGFYNGTADTVLNWCSNVNLVSDGTATLGLSVNKNGHFNVSVIFNNVVNVLWENINVQVTGNNFNNVNVMRIYGTTDSSVKFMRCNFTNYLTGVGLADEGITTDNTASPVFTECFIKSVTNRYANGVAIFGASAPIFFDCTIIGGANAGVFITSSGAPSFNRCNITAFGQDTNAVHVDATSAATFTACKISGGGGGIRNNGLYTGSLSSPSFSSCTFIGGGYGTSSHGALISDISSPSFVACTFIGGNNGTFCNGVNIARGGTPIFTGCAIYSGSGGTACDAIYMAYNTAPVFTETSIIGGEKTTASFTYDDANSGRFTPYTTKPYVQISMYVHVITATPGAELKLGSTAGGSEIATGISLSTTGYKYINFTRQSIAAGGYMYATPNTTVADGTFIVYYSVITNYATTPALNMQSNGNARFSSCTFIGNAASNTISIAGSATTSLKWMIVNSHIETYNPVSMYAVSASSAIAGAPIYNCVFVGGVNNVTPANGTASGTNIIVG